MSPPQQEADTAQQRRPPNLVAVIVVSIAAVIGVSSVLWALQAEGLRTSPDASNTRDEIVPVEFPVIIRKPDGPPRVSTEIVGAEGKTVTVSCSTCHATRKPDLTNKTATDLNEFHVGMNVMHGTLSCLSCHNPDNYDSLKLADGTRVEYTDVMTLCAQCHGPQMTDYKHNAHGGLNGYWDRSRGPQTKLNCVDCHHPHAPQFPKMHPTFKPKDRFLSPKGADH